MSRNSYSKNKDASEDKEEQPEEDDADEHFYESLDRIASSSCSCSASNSDSDPDPNPTPHSNDLPSPVLNFPMGVAKYDVWVSEPESVSERRRRLLSRMGLSGAHPPLSDGSDHLTQEQPGPSSSGPIFRDRIDNGDDDFNLCSSSPHLVSCHSPRILSHDSVNVNSDKDNTNVVTKKAAAVNKPPSGKKMDVNRSDSMNSVEGFDYNGEIAVNALTTIKNLDNGTQFVVNEIKEDGTWNKLKEVGTGRQLTMEEFEISVGHSPIVQELMRRQNVEDGENLNLNTNGGVNGGISKQKKKGNWFKTIKSVATGVKGHKERRSSDEGSDKGGRRSSSATDDSQDVSFHGPERVRVRQYGKSFKELSGLYKSQEIQAHNGSIWSIKFSLDGRYLASAGEDSVIHVWRVTELDRRGELLIDKGEDGNFGLFFGSNGSPEGYLDGQCEKKRRGRNSISRKSLSLDHHIHVPETVFGLTDKPICSFIGHQDDVLDLSWSKSQHLLSSSMDKTVRLWHLSSNSCLKTFSHSDYVTCIQFNPVNDQYFISGSLDSKVRIWSIPDHQVVDWSDLHEMVTAACYTPDGQGALVGTYKGTCRSYTATENKLQQKCEINLQNKKKKVHLRKITGFQFARGSSTEVLITSADSRIRVIDGIDMIHKFKGLRTTNSPISASLTSNGKYVVSASEDSYVYIWNHEAESRPSRPKSVTVTRSYEHFHCQDVSTAIPWPGMGEGHDWPLQDLYNQLDEVSIANHPPTPVQEMSDSPLNGIICSATNGYFFDRISATWPEEKLSLATRTKSRTPSGSFDFCNGVDKKTSAAYGMVIVTAGLGGEIRSYQNFGLGVRI